MLFRIVFVVCIMLSLASAKIYERCEFVRQIRDYGVPEDQVPVWTCIVQHESNYDTAAVNGASGDHGIYQISQLYWCSVSDTPGGGCNARCAQFEDDDIRDDTDCARLIYSQSGFNAWTTYPSCQGDVSGYVAGC